MKEKQKMRFGIVPTYRCNMACKDCNRHLDRIKWPDSDMSVENLKLGGKIVRDCGYQPDRIRFTGGEPLLHPDIREMAHVVNDEWKPGLRLVSFSNGSIKLKRRLPLRLNKANLDTRQHRPWLISPADLGIVSTGGWKSYCHTRLGCGTLFDCYGFSFCVLAGALGRLLRIDPYKTEPFTNGIKEICQHCICSVPVSRRFKIQDAAFDGEFEYPTKTYREGLEAFKQDPFLFAKFKERLYGEPKC